MEIKLKREQTVHRIKIEALLTIFVRYIPIVLIFLISLSTAGCKSHKKNQKQNIQVEQTVEIKPEKFKKKKEKKSVGHLIAEESVTWVGTPYGYGRSEKGVATDCSGLVLVVFKEIAEIKMPRNSAEQADFCSKLDGKDIKPGDLVFFATGKDAKKVSHVGVMLDGNRFVHASASKGVIISEMTTPYYKRTFIKYGRVPGLWQSGK